MPIDRRTFLQAGLAATAGLPAAARALPGQTPAVSASPSPDVIVIGAGAFGGWTALYLRERGLRVTLLDAYGAGNPRATSGDETRQIRVGYGARAMYSRWVLEAFRRWEARQRDWGRTLLTRVGRLQMAPRWTNDLDATDRVLRELKVEVERLDRGEMQRRYPQMRFDGLEVGLLEPGAGVLRAREACLAVAEALQKAGGSVAVARALAPAAAGPRLDAVPLGDGTRLSAGTYVFACGPWLKTLFPAEVGPRLSTPRRDVFYFGMPAGDLRFMPPHLPNFSEADYYGFPSIDHKGVKICPVGERVEFDPDLDERLVAAWQVKRARDYVAARFPALGQQPIVETRVCQLENTANEHFLIDRHPAWDNVWIAGGGSGHGFKHGPVVGEYIADRAMGQPGDPELGRLFSLSGRETATA